MKFPGICWNSLQPEHQPLVKLLGFFASDQVEDFKIRQRLENDLHFGNEPNQYIKEREKKMVKIDDNAQFTEVICNSCGANTLVFIQKKGTKYEDDECYCPICGSDDGEFEDKDADECKFEEEEMTAEELGEAIKNIFENSGDEDLFEEYVDKLVEMADK